MRANQKGSLQTQPTYTRTVNVCSGCGADPPEGARFCPACGTPVEAPAEQTREEERRIVTILFVDLVGFRERSDHADPEDVRRRLVPFHQRVKQDIERFGGTLEHHRRATELLAALGCRA